MPLPQDISPLNPELMDTIVRAPEMDWVPQDDTGTAFVKLLWTGSETGHWCALFKWAKGYVAPAHKHLSGAHVYVVSGKLEVRDAVFNAGDYVYERNGMIHETTTALEDTVYLFLCEGTVLFYDENGFTGYLGWEELERQAQEFARSKAA